MVRGRDATPISGLDGSSIPDDEPTSLLEVVEVIKQRVLLLWLPATVAFGFIWCRFLFVIGSGRRLLVG